MRQGPTARADTLCQIRTSLKSSADRLKKYLYNHKPGSEEGLQAACMRRPVLRCRLTLFFANVQAEAEAAEIEHYLGMLLRDAVQ